MRKKKENTLSTEKNVRFKKKERKHAFDKEKSKIQEKKKEITLLTKKKRKKTQARLRKKASFKIFLLSFNKFPPQYIRLEIEKKEYWLASRT